MCGIAGIYNPNGIVLDEIITLSNTLKHRGPDDEGFFLSNGNDYEENFRGNDTIPELQSLKHISEASSNCKLALVHRRLSIIDPSELGHQPFISDNNRYVLVFNGEVYNFKEIRHDLELKGYKFRSSSDTEVVLNAFIEWGESCVERFVGMWALVVYDKNKNVLTLSRDRFGIKPIYYCINEHSFAFASEIKTLLKINDIDKTISNENLGSYLTYGTVAHPYQNLFKNIIDVEPGSNYQFDLNTLELSKRNYYNILDSFSSNSFDIKTNTLKFQELFHDSVALHLRSDVEVGSCLSGGLDSSAIVYTASNQLNNTSFKTITASYKDKSVDESDFARMVTKPLKNVDDHYTYPDSKTLLTDIERLIYYQDLPIGSTSMFAQWEVMKGVNQLGIKVLLDGQGSDEILGGYYNFAGLYLIELLKGFKFHKFFKEYYSLKNNFTPNINNAILRAAYYYLPSRLQSRLRAKERLSYNFIDSKKLDELDLIPPRRGGKSFKENAQLSVQYGLYDLLRYEDRSSMAFSIESRVPFLDHRLVNFIMTLPTNQKILGGWTKYILRRSIDKKVDDRVVWRKDKKGFVTPQKDWKKETMKILIEELKQSKMPDIMNRSYIMELCNKDFSDATHLSEFWRAYSVIKWYNVFQLKG